MQSKITIRIILTILIVCAWAGTAVAESSTISKRATFSLPVPSGFSKPTAERFVKAAPGGVVLIENKRVKPNMFLASIVVKKIASGPDFDPSDSALCKEMANGMAAQMDAVLKANQMVMTSAGNMCQWTLTNMKESNRGFIGTLMYKTRDNAWIVGCNFDNSDRLAQDACAEVLKGWAFK